MPIVIASMRGPISMMNCMARLSPTEEKNSLVGFGKTREVVGNTLDAEKQRRVAVT